ncbi:DNA repair protein RecN [Caloranaerobacter azorensis H53214]|uniref:DNA repair protein RecN n=1 Tax=Caloranaerobacter azorensis H53214 TaxID=1156417 RepID=A0A096BKV8_9FIRM|nr:DNA repair protein RecN [Caloranaerobacter azorensis]KGG81413.1 DNA repair protein RecN [Caloranaerobacter azorensis H53214]
MLLELNISNFIIIDKMKITLSKGFNIITGETGSGKSIVIDALNILLGGRASRDYIRTGCDKAFIEGLFYLEKLENIKDVLDEYGIEFEQDNMLLISREIFSSGKSISRINGRVVTLSMLNKLTKKLVDLHGQHEHQSLLLVENHIELLDSLGKENIESLIIDVKKEFDRLKKLKNRLKEIGIDEMEKERKIDLLKFQLNEIDSAELRIDEEEKIIGELNLLSNAEDLLNIINNILECINSNDYYETSLLDQISSVSKNLAKMVKYDDKFMEYNDIIETIYYQLKDIATELRLYQETIEYNPERIKLLEERLDLINNLKRKYGSNIEEILKYRDKISYELEVILNNEREIENIKKEISSVEEKLNVICEKLSNERKLIAKQIEVEITNELKELNLKDAKFEVSFEKLDHFTEKGLDRVEFLIATNPGEPLKPLNKVASGGELSRIMLAIKTILADVDNIPCLVFDEIDTGISGKTAMIVGEKIRNISQTHQIICITHLPQIAVLGDSHFYIEKKKIEGKVVAKINKLNYEERVNEISRLLGGTKLTEMTKKLADEMLMASNKKNKVS